VSGVAVYEHGKTHAYKVHGCRCGPCTAANTECQRRYVKRLRTRNVPAGGHGTVNGYRNYGCRCVACCEASAEAGRQYRAVRKARAA